ncbi:MAG: cyclic nucleotide-binding domain-containing protein, partial [Anaerolineae bacterium]
NAEDNEPLRAQGLIILGVVLFVVVAIFAQRTMVLEQFGPDQVIFHEGDEGRHVYVIKSGAVEVLLKRPDGSREVLNRLGPGDHFGEMALLRHAPRNATIRTATAAEVFKMTPSSFVALYTNLPGLRDHFNTVMEARLRELDSSR